MSGHIEHQRGDTDCKCGDCRERFQNYYDLLHRMIERCGTDPERIARACAQILFLGDRLMEKSAMGIERAMDDIEDDDEPWRGK